jgi:hypothetical protein
MYLGGHTWLMVIENVIFAQERIVDWIASAEGSGLEDSLQSLEAPVQVTRACGDGCSTSACSFIVDRRFVIAADQERLH